MLSLPVYLDNNATTRVDPRVLEAMLPYFTERYGNAASRHHRFGWQAEEAVDRAREQVAALIGAAPREIVFTSGATESDNLALKGLADFHQLVRNLDSGQGYESLIKGVAVPRRGGHLIVTTIEHKAVLDTTHRLEREGCRLTVLPVDRQGFVTPEQVEAALTEQTILVSVMAANNEVGTLEPIRDIGRLCKRRGVLFHSDAVQAASTLPLDVEDLGVDLLSLSAHKMYGPKGVGALYVRRQGPRVRLEPQIDGGGHERGVRSGTLPVPLVVGFGKACELCREEGSNEAKRLAQLRERLRQGIMGELEGVCLNGPPVDRLPGNLNLSFAFVHGDALLTALKDVAVSSGSACTSAEPEPSYVLRALGVSDELAHASLRFGLGRFTTAEEIDFVVAEVVRAVHRLRALSPEYEMHRRSQGAEPA